MAALAMGRGAGALKAWRALRGEVLVGWLLFNHLLSALTGHSQGLALGFDGFFFLNSCLCLAVDDVRDRALDAGVAAKSHRFAFWTRFGMPALVVAGLLTVVGSVSFAQAGGWLGAYLGWLFIALAYAPVFKRGGWLAKNGAVALAVVLGYWILARGYGRELPALAAAVVVAKVLWSELMLDAGDRGADRAVGVWTAPARFGLRRCAWILGGLQALALGCQFALYWSGSGRGWALGHGLLAALLLGCAVVDQLALRRRVEHDGWRRQLFVIYEFALVLFVLAYAPAGR